ncbi:MAG: hypothetical protein JSV73_06315 [Flavobacteriaceae bacterium]|nr:MAG: hypothetical protein JSV73_06315 [Flavobacteriaceae bacterium]
MEDMKTRFTLYGIGFVIGIVIVFFFLGGKNASCNWLPNARILNIIQQKKISISQEVRAEMQSTYIDSLQIMQLIKTGDIDFSKSRVKNEPCRNYWIEGGPKDTLMIITVDLCDSVAIVKSLQVKPK